MDNDELRLLVERVNEMTPEHERKDHKFEYMLDFGSTGVLLNVSIN